MEFNSRLTKELCELYGPTGRELRVAEYIQNKIRGHVDEMWTDCLGNLIAHKKGPGKKVVLSAHMDQLGLMIKTIDEKGFARIAALGSIKPYNLIDSRVQTESGVQGVMLCEKKEDMGKLTHHDLYIDFAALSAEAVRKKVRIGEVAITRSEYYENEDCVIMQCLDDRIGCMIIIDNILRDVENTNDMYYVFTVQEENGCFGAQVSTFDLQPDLFVTFDVACTGDELRGIRTDVRLGCGAAIKVMDYFMIVNKQVVDVLVDIAEKNKVKYQMEVSETGGTDAHTAQLVRGGIRSGAITIPTRNIHSRNEMICKADILECIRLAMALETADLNSRFGA